MPSLSITRILAAIGGVITLGAISVPLLAAPADEIRSRVDGLRELGAAYKSVNDGLRGSDVQTMLIQISARQIRNAATEQYHWFPAGSGPASGLKTAAKPEIWTQAAKFKAAQDGFATEANTFFATARSGDANAMRAGARKLGMTCKSCHDSFKTQEKK